MVAVLTIQTYFQDNEDLDLMVEQLENLGYNVTVETHDEDEVPDYEVEPV